MRLPVNMDLPLLIEFHVNSIQAGRRICDQLGKSNALVHTSMVTLTPLAGEQDLHP